jgi:hypothetical protein
VFVFGLSLSAVFQRAVPALRHRMKTPVDTKQRIAAERFREVSKVIVFSSWGS